jgi:hypothetical protein
VRAGEEARARSPSSGSSSSLTRTVFPDTEAVLVTPWVGPVVQLKQGEDLHSELVLDGDLAFDELSHLLIGEANHALAQQRSGAP